MKEKTFIKNIPVIIWGEESDKVFLYVHGQGGSKDDAELFAQVAGKKQWQVISIDLPGHGDRKEEEDHFDPWTVVPELRELLSYIRGRWNRVSLFANSIGAWFSMLSFGKEQFEQCLFLSPVLNMYRLISNMIQWAGATEDRLRKEGVIPTDFGQTLYWDYYQYAKNNMIEEWKSPTAILYGTADNLIEYETVTAFTEKFGCQLTVMDGGEHWFHTEEQLTVMKNWAEKLVTD